MKDIRMGKLLQEYGYISKEQLEYAIACQESEWPDKLLAEVLVLLEYITEEQQLEMLKKDRGMELVDLSTYPVDAAAVEQIPETMALKYGVIAIRMDGIYLTVAVNDPLNLYAVEDIRLVTNMHLDLVLAYRENIQTAISLYYSEIEARIAASCAANRAARREKMPNYLQDQVISGITKEQTPVVRLLNSLLIKGYNTNVSDIHMEPQEHETVIRMRRDGMLLPYMTLPRAIHQGLVARTKILAQMDIAEKRRPQDGHFKICLDNREFNIRVSFVPTLYGEKGVLRFLNTNTAIDRSSFFGMSEENYRKMLELLKNPHGIIYLTGPTGSGKTTTLYSILQQLSARPVNIATIEDPIEQSIAGLNQLQVNEKAGLTFESGLRSLLRQDPDILMIGETRDYQTAVISARAAITGHLVFSTLHTNDAVSSIARLRDMGLENYMIADSLTGVVAQRLVRKICPHCRGSQETDEDGGGKARGCHLCGYTGYKGRTAIHEILPVDAGFRHMTATGRPLEELREYAISELHMTSLRKEAKILLRQGIIDREELQRVTYGLK